jgi:hypothetical protein
MDHNDRMALVITEDPYTNLSATCWSTFMDTGRAWLLLIHIFINQHESKSIITRTLAIYISQINTLLIALDGNCRYCCLHGRC